MPFWIDPIWTNNNNSEKPKDDLVSFLYWNTLFNVIKFHQNYKFSKK